MKKFALLAACVAAFFMSGCSTTAGSNVQAKVAAACPVVQVAVADVQALGAGLSADLQGHIAAAAPVIAQICAGNATVDTSTIQALVATTFPALITDVNASVLAADQKAKISTALALAQIAFTAVVQAEGASSNAAATTQ